jgi:hypothetical protein
MFKGQKKKKKRGPKHCLIKALLKKTNEVTFANLPHFISLPYLIAHIMIYPTHNLAK